VTTGKSWFALGKYIHMPCRCRLSTMRRLVPLSKVGSVMRYAVA